MVLHLPFCLGHRCLRRDGGRVRGTVALSLPSVVWTLRMSFLVSFPLAGQSISLHNRRCFLVSDDPFGGWFLLEWTFDASFFWRVVPTTWRYWDRSSCVTAILSIVFLPRSWMSPLVGGIHSFSSSLFPSGRIVPATFRLVTQCLNKLSLRVPLTAAIPFILPSCVS